MAAKKKIQKKASKKTARKKPTKALVIVESPAKARTINKYLGRGYLVRSRCAGRRARAARKAISIG